jgi:hypothetical protein
VRGRRALARGHRWLALLESGEVKSLRELARREGVDSSYARWMVNLTTLDPDIVAAILDETLPPELTLFELAVDPPALWEEQRWLTMPLSIMWRRDRITWYTKYYKSPITRRRPGQGDTVAPVHWDQYDSVKVR